jgi:hypothetical protein
VDRLGANYEDERVSLASTRKKQATPQGMTSCTQFKMTLTLCKLLTINVQKFYTHIRKELHTFTLQVSQYAG